MQDRLARLELYISGRKVYHKEPDAEGELIYPENKKIHSDLTEG